MTSRITQLKNAESLRDLAELLGMEPRHLSYALYISREPKYFTFEIPKKSGGVRVINAPSKRLKSIQRSLADLLADCVGEIEGEHPRKPLSHGFRRGRSILSNANPHTGRRFVLNLDIENFFPTINFGRVRGYFIKNRDFELHPSVATVIAQIACDGTALPQGSPCSPIISDLVAHILDVRLVRLAREHGCTYSRYADDLTFSTNQKEFPRALATFDSNAWSLGAPLVATVENSKFEINNAKTRMQCRISRQTVTGLVVNRKLNVRDEYFRRARTMCHSLFMKGAYHRHGTTTAIKTPNQIEGILSHIDHVKSSSDFRDEDAKRARPFASYKLSQKLSFFRTFAILEKPLILCEGPSDALYLKVAIQQMAWKYPELIDTAVEPAKLRIRFFNYHSRASSLLRLTGGTGPVKLLMEKYESRFSEFGYKPMSFPVIVLVDNDDGAKGIFSYISKKYNLKTTPTTTADFYPVWGNLYVVKTPEKGAEGTSKIEDCFQASFLATPFNGKTFNADDDKLGPNEFGKMVLAGIVRSNAEKIDFAGFEPLLDRIVAAVEDYRSKIMSVAT